MVQRLVDRLRQQPRLVFLIDGLGAMVSALSLGVVLPAFEGYVGMPRRVLAFLAVVALAFATGSIACYVGSRRWRRALRIISSANLAYCGVTAALVVAYWAPLTVVGVTYFALEILVIGGLVVVERRLLAAADASVAERRTND